MIFLQQIKHAGMSVVSVCSLGKLQRLTKFCLFDNFSPFEIMKKIRNPLWNLEKRNKIRAVTCNKLRAMRRVNYVVK